MTTLKLEALKRNLAKYNTPPFISTFLHLNKIPPTYGLKKRISNNFNIFFPQKITVLTFNSSAYFFFSNFIINLKGMCDTHHGAYLLSPFTRNTSRSRSCTNQSIQIPEVWYSPSVSGRNMCS